MTVAELIRQLADKLDQIEAGTDANVLAPNNSEPSDAPKMMTPNQQKLELLKKGVGVDSEFDDCDNQSDPLDDMKKRAGISTAVVHLAADDEPLE